MQAIAQESNLPVAMIERLMKQGSPRTKSRDFEVFLHYVTKMEQREEKSMQREVFKSVSLFIGDAVKIFDVNNNAMEPEFSFSDKILAAIVKYLKQLHWGNVYVVVDHIDMVSIRKPYQIEERLDAIELRAMNTEKYPPVTRLWSDIKNVYKINAVIRTYVPLLYYPKSSPEIITK